MHIVVFMGFNLNSMIADWSGTLKIKILSTLDQIVIVNVLLGQYLNGDVQLLVLYILDLGLLR